MAGSVLVDVGFLVALLSRRDTHHRWAVTQAPGHAPPWLTCVIAAFGLNDDLAPVLNLLQKYADVPMSLADACLVRLTETLSDPVVLTTDSDFRIYRRHSRRMVPCVLPS